jgi:membrane protein YqaA with SNARE-associated domain
LLKKNLTLQYPDTIAGQNRLVAGEHCSGLNHFDNQFLTHVVTLYEWLNQPGYPALFFMSFLASTLLPLGSEWLLVMMLAGGYDPVATVAVATFGNYLGAVVTYLIGLGGGIWLVEKVLKVSPPQQERARSYYHRFGRYSLLFSWLPFIGDPLCLVGGMLRINFGLFSLLVATGKCARYIVTAALTLLAIG